MSILDIKINNQSKHFKKTIITYVVMSILAVVVNNIYAIFGHGVSSDAMTWMFLYPLIGGVVYFLFLGITLNKINRFSGYRPFYNLHNSGIATITFGSFLQGVMEIAGADSIFITYFYIVGGLLVGMGLILVLVMAANQKRIS